MLLEILLLVLNAPFEEFFDAIERFFDESGLLICRPLTVCLDRLSALGVVIYDFRIQARRLGPFADIELLKFLHIEVVNEFLDDIDIVNLIDDILCGLLLSALFPQESNKALEACLVDAVLEGAHCVQIVYQEAELN